MPIYQTPKDRDNETEVACWLSQRWDCQIKNFSSLSSVDWYIEHRGRLVGIAELKCRNMTHTTYQTIFMSVAKWFCLTHGSFGLNVPGLFIVRFTDQVRWIEVKDIDATQHAIKGRKDRPNSRSAIEPIIEIPISQMVPA